MSRALISVFFVADVGGVVWCLNVLGHELVRQLRFRSVPVVDELAVESPPELVPIPAQQGTPEPASLRLVS